MMTPNVITRSTNSVARDTLAESVGVCMESSQATTVTIESSGRNATAKLSEKLKAVRCRVVELE